LIPAAFALVASLALAAFIILRRAGGGSFPWFAFYLKGKECGFRFSQVNLLRKIAVENRIKNPTCLYWSVKQLDGCIRGTIIRYRSAGTESGDEATALISKLFDLRKRVEFNQPKYNLRLKSSREIMARQRLEILHPAAGLFRSVVIENLREYLAVSSPPELELPLEFSWKGQPVTIGFWREGDAGYTMKSKILAESARDDSCVLHVAHTTELAQTGRRRSVRADIRAVAKFYPVKSIENATLVFESKKALTGLMKDISEDGAAIFVGGRAKPGLAVKLQVPIGGRSVVMCGVARAVEYDRSKNLSLLHLQAAPPPERVKNTICSYVYDIFGDQGGEKANAA